MKRIILLLLLCFMLSCEYPVVVNNTTVVNDSVIIINDTIIVNNTPEEVNNRVLFLAGSEAIPVKGFKTATYFELIIDPLFNESWNITKIYCHSVYDNTTYDTKDIKWADYKYVLYLGHGGCGLYAANCVTPKIMDLNNTGDAILIQLGCGSWAIFTPNSTCLNHDFKTSIAHNTSVGVYTYQLRRIVNLLLETDGDVEEVVARSGIKTLRYTKGKG